MVINTWLLLFYYNKTMVNFRKHFWGPSLWSVLRTTRFCFCVVSICSTLVTLVPSWDSCLPVTPLPSIPSAPPSLQLHHGLLGPCLCLGPISHQLHHGPSRPAVLPWLHVSLTPSGSSPWPAPLQEIASLVPPTTSSRYSSAPCHPKLSQKAERGKRKCY